MFEWLTYVSKKKFARSIGLSPFYVDKVCYIFLLCTWNSGLNLVTQMVVTYVTWLLSLRRQLEKYCRQEKFVLHERLHCKDFDVNELTQYSYHFFSYCIFISYFQFSQFSQLTHVSLRLHNGERNFKKFLEYNKYGLI